MRRSDAEIPNDPSRPDTCETSYTTIQKGEKGEKGPHLGNDIEPSKPPTYSPARLRAATVRFDWSQVGVSPVSTFEIPSPLHKIPARCRIALEGGPMAGSVAPLNSMPDPLFLSDEVAPISGDPNSVLSCSPDTNNREQRPFSRTTTEITTGITAHLS